MKKLHVRCVLPVFAVASLLAVGAASQSAEKSEPQFGHMVFFTLKEHSKESREKFVAACQKYLTGHEGVVSLSIGTASEDALESFNDKDFDVALHMVFDNKKSCEKYMKAKRHMEFFAETKENWAKVRVFDSNLAPSKK